MNKLLALLLLTSSASATPAADNLIINMVTEEAANFRKNGVALLVEARKTNVVDNMICASRKYISIKEKIDLNYLSLYILAPDHRSVKYTFIVNACNMMEWDEKPIEPGNVP